jgi:bifunctional non-homologous end joining protein LigD
VLDLDPGDDVPWQDVIEAAHLVRARLKGLGLESWPKTTGGKGPHLHVPFEPELCWDDVFAFSRAFAESLAASERGFTTSFNKADREGRILIDYKRNYGTSIAIAAFSPRARPHAPVAVPVSWREVTRKLEPDGWTVQNLGRRLARQRTDPWAGYWSAKQRLTGILKKH